MNLSPHFTYAEFTRSDTALRLGLTNDLPCELVHNAKATAAMLERIRDFLGHPMAVTSGYRCLELNRAIKSKDTSDHVQALACDFVCPPTPPLLIAQRLAAVMDELQIGQLILEYNVWVHVGVTKPDKILNRILTINDYGTTVGITNRTDS